MMIYVFRWIFMPRFMLLGFIDQERENERMRERESERKREKGELEMMKRPVHTFL
jgi:hypothetical protein